MENSKKMIPLSDDELTGAAGGANSGGSEELARAEGRTVFVAFQDLLDLCGCNDGQIWAASIHRERNGEIIYSDVKCYSCGAQKNRATRQGPIPIMEPEGRGMEAGMPAK
jgi:hypothetical protein